MCSSDLGLVAAFLLDLAGVPRTVICEDYGLTAALLTSSDADKQLDPKQPGAYLRGCAPETMDRTLAFVDETFGGVHAYLKQEGVTDVELNAIRAKLVEA